MEEQSYYYQLSLALKSDKYRYAVDLKKLQEDLWGARDEFNCILSESHIALLKPNTRRINLLLKNSAALEQQNVNTVLARFIQTLLQEFEWSAYCGADGELFTVKAFKPMDREACALLLREARKKNAAFFNSFESNLFFGEDILQGASEIGQEPTYRRQLGLDNDDDDDDDDKPDHNLKEACRSLESTVGFTALKTEIRLAIKMMDQLVAHLGKPAQGINPFPYHYLVTLGGPGMELTPVLKLLAAIFYHTGICKKYNFDEYTIEDADSFYIHRVDDDGLVAIHDIDILAKEDPEDFTSLIYKMKVDTGRAVYFLTVTGKGDEEVRKLRQKIEEQVSLRTFHIPLYSNEELLQITANTLQDYGITMTGGASKELLALFAKTREASEFKGDHSIRKITEKLRFGKIEQMFMGKGRYSVIKKQDVSRLAAELFNKDPLTLTMKDAFAELEQVIGLEQVKQKILEICRVIALNKKKAELGIIDKRPSLHMLFTGNPGTGKTTLARIVAAILKHYKVLSKGGFFEVSREDLVSIYLGGTTNRTRRKIREAYGGVLFIDEAYSLDGGHIEDYGREALATLVKEMEDKRDDLVVILAGYTEEMEKMLEINPGLKTRIAHKVEFPNYDAPELLQIMKKELGSAYSLEEGGEAVLLRLFNEACREADRYFGNGRFARTVAERLLAKQALRLGEQENHSREVLQHITLPDIEAAARDTDIATWRQANTRKGGIGF